MSTLSPLEALQFGLLTTSNAAILDLRRFRAEIDITKKFRARSLFANGNFLLTSD